LLAGALGGIGAWAASAIGRASPVRATDGQPLIQGADNSGTLGTLVRISTSSTALQGLADATSGTTYGLRGRNSSTAGAGVYGVAAASSGGAAGVKGVSNSEQGYGVQGGAFDATYTGVSGDSSDRYGVLGFSKNLIGVKGISQATGPGGAGVFGQSTGGNTGVMGSSGGIPDAKPKTGVYGDARQDSTSKGVWGYSLYGHGVHGESTTGWAGYFDGRVLTKKYHELVEISTPAAPASNHARLFVRDNGNGKTQLCVRFHTGAVKVLAMQP
jgi:hypothetical protein